MKQNSTPFFFVICFGLIMVDTATSVNKVLKIKDVLDEWTLEKMKEVTDTLPHIAGRKSPLRKIDLSLINIKKIPDKLEQDNRYWKKLPDWNTLFSYEKIKLVFEKAKNTFERKQLCFSSRIFGNQFFRRAYQFDQDDVIHVIGDLHGGGLHDIYPFMDGKLNQKLKIIDKRNHFVVLGDMVDGGLYSYETLYFVMILFLKNNKNIHIIRGNHEDIELNETYGFFSELIMKYRDCFEDDEQLGFAVETLLQQYINPLYGRLPVVLFGVFPDSCLIIPFCHGTIDLHDQHGAKEFINDFLCIMQKEKRKEYFKIFSTMSGISGYQWNDHTVHEDDETSNSERDKYKGMLKVVGKKDTEKWLQEVSPDQYSMPCIISAHQHSMHMNDLMPLFFGHYYIAFLWNNNPLVFTLCVNPGSGFSLPRNNEDLDLCFPGILHATTLTLSDAAKKIAIIRHQNTKIGEWVKNQHIHLFNNHIVENGLHEVYHRALLDDFYVYLDCNKIDRNDITEEHLIAFLKHIVTVERTETIATFSYNSEKKQMQLDLFYLPQALQKALHLSENQIHEIHENRRYPKIESKQEPYCLPTQTNSNQTESGFQTDLMQINSIEKTPDEKQTNNDHVSVKQPNNAILKKIAYSIIIVGAGCFLLTLLQQNDQSSFAFQKALSSIRTFFGRMFFERLPFG